MFASVRRLTRPFPEALQHIGLAQKNAEGQLQPTWAAVLLFSEEPSGLLRTKASIRIFHYKSDKVDYLATPNLAKPPKTVSGPLISQIADAYRVVLDELASGVQMGSLGFEVVQKYPTRVIKEVITNAVIHRDYSIPSDIQIRIFPDRIEVSSPGALPGKVTVQNIHRIGSVSRNSLIVSNLREFPDPPNLDAGEGVRMMMQTMNAAGLYPPLYFTRKTKTIGNAEVRRIMKSDDTLSASKQLKRWVDQGLLAIDNPEAGKRVRRYRLAEVDTTGQLFSFVYGKQIRS
jgi:ATP-dependent DNA helicase RecG